MRLQEFAETAFIFRGTLLTVPCPEGRREPNRKETKEKSQIRNIRNPTKNNIQRNFIVPIPITLLYLFLYKPHQILTLTGNITRYPSRRSTRQTNKLTK
jgi:hypothetical protein